jgi:hypothetical protein
MMNNISTIDEMGEIGVSKNIYIIQKKKMKCWTLRSLSVKDCKVAFVKFIQNVSFTSCCTRDCCQHFLHEKTITKRKMGFCNQLLRLFLSKATSVLVACDKN